MATLAFCFSLIGIIALVRLEKLIKTLKEKNILDTNYKSE